ncbi:MAG: hypothetical protein IKK96_05125 [Lachnospiraceae bacterium]|nr:hypothetical protein [Lachnospiraceae bacterium]
MIKLAIGMLFVLMNFSLDIGDLSINILPEFVGWLLFLSAAEKLKTKSEYFDKISGALFFMSIYKIADYIVSMLNINAGTIATVFFYGGIVTTVLGLYLLYRIFCGIEEIAQKDDVRVKTGRIFTLFKINVVITILAYLNNFTGIYYNYLWYGKIAPALTRPIFKLLSLLPANVISILSGVAIAIILVGVVIKFFIILFTFEVCTDYDKIMTERSGRKKY